MDAKTAKALRSIANAVRAEGEILAAKADDIEALLADAGQDKVQVTAYSQNDPRWAGEIYAGGTTFASAGCYVVCVCMVCSFAGYLDTPPQTAARLREAGCFNGNMLSYPNRIPNVYGRLMWPPDAYHNRPGERITEATWEAVKRMIGFDGPLILKVDYRPENRVFNMHFILGTRVLSDDLEIIDPLDGQTSTLLERYGQTRGWDVRQAIFGYRRLKVR